MKHYGAKFKISVENDVADYMSYHMEIGNEIH